MQQRMPKRAVNTADQPSYSVLTGRHSTPPRTSRTSRAYSHLTWACGGFLLGAVCWHMVGFWSFIDRVLDETPHLSIAASKGGTGHTYTRGKLAARLVGASNDCVARYITTGINETVVAPCARPIVAMQAE